MLKIFSVLADFAVFIIKFIGCCYKKYDVIIVKNFIVPFGSGIIEKCAYCFIRGNSIVYDIDDAIYLDQTRVQNRLFSHFRSMKDKVAFWLGVSDKLSVSNDIIKQDLEDLEDLSDKQLIQFLSAPYARQYFTNVSDVKLEKRDVDNIRVIWLGSPHTQQDVEVFLPLLKELEDIISKLKIYIIGATDDFTLHGLKSVVYLKWTPDIEKHYMRIAHIGINPLKNDMFQQRKSAFKVIQYYRAGVVPIVSNVGINKSLITKYGGYVVDYGSSLTDVVEFIKDYINDIISNAIHINNNSEELSVEENAKKILDLINDNK